MADEDRRASEVKAGDEAEDLEDLEAEGEASEVKGGLALPYTG